MSRHALILDRDGVINEDRGYVHRPEEVVFISGIFDLCRAARAHGRLIIIVTNQAGIGRGIYTERQFIELSEWMRVAFSQEGVELAEIYHCPYHLEHGIGFYKRSSYDRKPNPGMILAAREQFNLDLARSIMVGDRSSDMVAALRAGVGERILFNACEDANSDACTLRVSELRQIIPLLGDAHSRSGKEPEARFG